MIIAAFVITLGLIIGAWAATAYGYRLGGVVVVPLFVIYTLLNFVSVPIFVLSTVLAYVGVSQVQQRWLVYGRRLLLTSIIIGMVLPVVVFVVLDILRGNSPIITELVFLGSILPGIAAYNFHREDSELRVRDAVAAVGLSALLFAVGVVALVLWSTPPCVTCPYFPDQPATYVSPLLLSSSSDIAGLLGYEMTSLSPTVGTVGTITMVTVIGLALSEISRIRLGFRPVGVITLPLIAFFALRVWWAVPLYLVTGTLTLFAVVLIHRWTLLYGRALLSLASTISVLLALGEMVLFGLTEPFVVFFTGIFGGIGAYNVHVVAPRERLEALAVNGGIFVVVFGLARLFITPLPTGLATPVTVFHLIGGGIVLTVCVLVWRSIEQNQPSREAVREAAPFLREKQQ